MLLRRLWSLAPGKAIGGRAGDLGQATDGFCCGSMLSRRAADFLIEILVGERGGLSRRLGEVRNPLEVLGVAVFCGFELCQCYAHMLRCFTHGMNFDAE